MFFTHNILLISIVVIKLNSSRKGKRFVGSQEQNSVHKFTIFLKYFFHDILCIYIV